MAPSEWGATVDYDTKQWTPWVPDKWVLHWGGTPVYTSAAAGVRSWEERQLRAWESFHINSRGWLGIAYNYAIGNSGTLYRLRGDNRSGATSGDYETDGIPENHEAVAVVFIVGSGQDVTAEAFATFRQMYATVPELELVIGHCDVFASSGTGTSTTCPGSQVAEWIEAKGYEGGGAPMYVRYGQLDPWVGYWQDKLGVPVDNDYGDVTAAAVASVVGGDGKFIGRTEAELIDPLPVPYTLVEAVGRRVWREQFQSVADKPTAEQVVTRTHHNVLDIKTS